MVLSLGLAMLRLLGSVVLAGARGYYLGAVEGKQAAVAWA